MTHPASLAALIAAAFSLAAPAALAQPVRVHLDEEASVGGIGVGCTGIGQTKNDPKWGAYPVKVEFAEPNGNYLAGEDLTVMGPGGRSLLEVSCEGPWVLLKLAPAKSYKLSATVDGRPPKTAVVRAPAHGQATFVMTFAGGGG